MGEHLHAELRVALAEGIVSEEEAPALLLEATKLARSPLNLLLERGRLTEETHASLWAHVHETSAQDEPDLASFPVPDWERYEPLRLLGQGGMGRVFLARDLRLGREVALKFVRGDNPELSRRIVSEARAQAQVSHPRVCEVYEVGEIRGKVYIAMRYIKGRSLSAVASEISVEQKALLIWGAALGVQEAHSKGLIHRDIKPSNILVERTDDGLLEPYVMDFGLARSVTEGVTVTGTVLGTPHYMAPEQARGEIATLDRRADVYSLGATLYAILTGEPPIPGENALEVLNRVAAVEPRPPRAIDPNIPPDLEAITLKCLEKDRSARYDSARALADDLTRFLRGEPVLARPGGLFYRLRKRLRKHAGAVAVFGAALLIALAALGYGLRERAEAAERERLSRHFTEITEQIESRARYAALSRLHDIHADREALRAELDALDAEVLRRGPNATALGHYALGRGFLAIDDDEKARHYLESAWERGYREPRVAYSLALCMARLYQRALLETERIKSDEARAARKAEIARLYRDPALFYLRGSEGARVPSTDYVAALIAYYEERFDDALSLSASIGRGLPWFYEALKLRGDIFLARALTHRNRGERGQAHADFEAGRSAYTAASLAAESVPSVHQALGELEYAELVMELYAGGSVVGAFERGVAAADRALAVDSDHYESLVLRARLRRSLAEHRSNQGGDIRELLAQAVADAERASTVNPARKEARIELARAYRQGGDDRQSRGEDASMELGKALAISESIAAPDRDYDYFSNLALIHQVWADSQDQAGVDSSDHRSKAIDAYLAAIDLQGRAVDAWFNLGINYFGRASLPGSKDADRDLEKAISALEKGRSIDPKHIVSYFYDGEIHTALARRRRDRGEDPGPVLKSALESYQEGLAINPKLPHLHNGIGVVLMEQAALAWDHGQSPDPLLAEAQASFERAIAVAPEQGYGYHNVGEALARLARYQKDRGEDPTRTAKAAALAAQKAIERIPDHAGPWSNLGMIHAIVAGHELAEGRDPTPTLTRAREALDKALAQNPSSAQAHIYLGEIRGQMARWSARRGGGDPAGFNAAADALQKGMDLAPEELEHALLFGRFCLEWYAFLKQSGRDPSPALARGMALADRVLASRPEWADARALRAGLLLAQAESAARAEEGGDRHRSAALEFTRALSANPNLDKAWGRSRKLAEKLAASIR